MKNNLIYVPIIYCTGMSQDFRLPIFFTYSASTKGAHKSFKVYGNITKLNTAYEKTQLINCNL